MKTIVGIGWAILSCLMLISCSSKQGGEGEVQNVPLVILDVDIPSSTDDMFALQMLYKYADAGKCKILGVVVDRVGVAGAEIVDVMNTYYGYPNVPIGLSRKGIENSQVWIDYSPLAKHTGKDGKPMFRRTHPDYADLPEGWRLYRQLLAKQPDHSVSICSVGFINALAQLLQSEADEHSPLNGVELVRQKVKAIYVMGSVLANANEPDYNLGLGIEFAQTFFQLWPQEVQMYFSPGDVGNGIDYPIDQVLEDYAWDKNHPIRQIYQNYPCDVGQRMWDPLVVIQAVEGNELFTLSEPCQVNITPEAVVVFTPSEKGNCRYQLPGTPEWNQQILQKIRETSFEK